MSVGNGWEGAKNDKSHSMRESLSLRMAYAD
jgi:hypothetical protein